jgi:uncharacterized protein YbjT (DUF2867 family)
MIHSEATDVGRPRVLVTGATGTVGAAVVDELVADASAHTVACVCDPETDRDRLRTPLPGPDAAPDTVDVLVFDFERPETRGPALAGVDRLFLMRPPSVSTDRVAKVAAADRVGVERVVYLSMLGAENNPLFPTGGSSALSNRSVSTTPFCGLPFL